MIHQDEKGTSFIVRPRETHFYDYFETLDDIFVNYNKTINKISYKTFSYILNKFVAELLINKTIASRDDVLKLKNKLQIEGNNCDTLIMPIHGIKLSNCNTLKLGPYSIFSHPTSNFFPKSIETYGVDPGYHISIENIEHSDIRYGVTLAKSAFDDFANIIHFMVGHKDDDYNIISGKRLETPQSDLKTFRHSEKYHALRNDSLLMCGISNKFIDPIEIDNDFFNNTINGNNRVWEYYTKHRCNKLKPDELPSRVIRSLIMTGKSIRAQELQDSLLHLITAYEVLLSHSERDLFHYSIGQNIGDSMAFILGKDGNQRKKISKFIKKIYGIRSAIVHNANKHPTDYEYSKALRYIKDFIYKLILDEKFNKIKKIEDLKNHIDDIRFDCN